MATHLEELVGHLLVLLGHGSRRRLGKHAEDDEDSQGSQDTNGGAKKNTLAFAWRGFSSGAMRAERDPVCCRQEAPS